MQTDAPTATIIPAIDRPLFRFILKTPGTRVGKEWIERAGTAVERPLDPRLSEFGDPTPTIPLPVP